MSNKRWAPFGVRPTHLQGDKVKLISAVTDERCGGIHLPDIESVKAALVAFSEDRTTGSRDVESAFAGQGGGMALALHATLPRSESTLVGRLCTQLEETLKRSDSFYKDYEYDGMGTPFMKTSVTVNKLKDGTYLLELNAAYVGNAPEEGIANYMDATRGLWWTSLNLTYDAIRGDDFVLDFSQLTSRLAGTPLEVVAAEELAEKIGGTASLVSPKHLSWTIDGLTVDFVLDPMSVGNDYDQAFVSTGTVLTGPKEKRWSDDKVQTQPKVMIRVDNNDSAVRSYDRVPAIDPDQQARMRTFVQDLKARFVT